MTKIPDIWWRAETRPRAGVPVPAWHTVYLTTLVVVGRGKVWIKLAPEGWNQGYAPGHTGAFWRRREWQASETPLGAVLALLEKKKHAVHHARARLQEQERALAAARELALQWGQDPGKVQAKPVFEPRLGEDYESGPW